MPKALSRRVVKLKWTMSAVHTAMNILIIVSNVLPTNVIVDYIITNKPNAGNVGNMILFF
jgi:hypothetical protein